MVTSELTANERNEREAAACKKWEGEEKFYQFLNGRSLSPLGLRVREAAAAVPLLSHDSVVLDLSSAVFPKSLHIWGDEALQEKRRDDEQE